MKIENKRLKKFIEDSGIIDQKRLEEVFKDAEKSKKNLSDLLLEKKILTKEKLLQLESYILGFPFIDLTKEKIVPDILTIIPEPIARKNNIIAYKKTENKLEVAMIDPEDLQTLDFVRKKTGLEILPRLTTKEAIQQALKQYEQSLVEEFKGLIKQESSETLLKKVSEETGGQEVENLEKQAQDLPIIKIVDSILRHAISQIASDIHIEPEEKDVLVRYRIDGILHDAMTLPKQIQNGVVARIKILSSLRLDEHRLPQDGRFTIETEDDKVSFRVSILPVYDGEKVVMRLLVEGEKGFTLEQLGFRNEALERIQRAIRKPLGMVLATGPTGSGKTTTLYTILDIVNKSGVNISTIEDPIEYRMPRINQTQVKPAIGLTFANGLRSLVRQDPDILMVGEIRDNETAGLAINASLTGHLVLSTLHTNSAAGAIPRLIDMEQEPFLIASTVNVIMAQRLVRTLCSESREKYNLTKKELETLGKDIDLDRMLQILKTAKAVDQHATWNSINFYKAVSSEDCAEGYKGRIGIHEVLEVTESIKKMITESATSDAIQEQSKKEGMVTMLEDGIISCVLGITTLEEVFRVTSE